MVLTITHTHEAGTLIDGTARGDGSAEVLKRYRWRWGRSIGAWFVPNSRDRLPQMHTINATAEALRAAGFVVELEVSTEVRDWAEVEAGKIERQAARVEALEAKAERKSGAEEAADKRAARAFDSLPWGGEPVKVGHHSEGRHRAAIAKADRTMRASIEAGKATEDARYRAEVASHTTDARYAPATVARRIEKLRAEVRDYDRRLAGREDWVPDGNGGHKFAHVDPSDEYRARLAPMRAETVAQLEYWEGVRAAQIAEGKAGDYSPATIAKGDLVRYRFADAAIVTRVNPKTVTVAFWPRWDADRMNTGTIPYGDLKGHTVPTDEQRAELLARTAAGAKENKSRHAAAMASLRGNR